MKFKLTSSQKNFYNKNFTLDSQIWNQGVMETFPKIYSYEEINNAYNKLVETHDSLRVKLVETDDGIVADVREHEYINYRFWQVETEEELMQKAQDFLNEPKDRYGLLVNCAVFQTPTTSGFMINAHHIVIDGFSAIAMASHVNEFLKDENFAPEVQKYADYVEAEEKHKQSRRYAKSQEFWLKEFSIQPDCNIVPASTKSLDFSSSESNHNISSELINNIKDFCTINDISITTFFNTVLSIFLSRKYETQKLTIGTPVLNRTSALEFNTVGLYMHLLPLIVNLSADTFLENAKQIEDFQLNLFRHQKFTQNDIKELLKENGKEQNNLFDVAFNYQEFDKNDEYQFVFRYSNYLSLPLEIHLHQFNGENHNLKIRYRTAMFDKQEIEIMLKSIVTLAEKALENYDKNINEIEMISTDEKEKVLKEFNNTTTNYAKDSCIHGLFEEQVERTPDKVALVAVDKTVTYKELNEDANRIAHSLIEKGIGKGDVVGLMLPRKSYLLSTLFGILKTGAAYLPIDMELPKERIEYMCKDTNAKLVVSEENIDSLLQSESTTNPCVEMANDSLCYCIYTSGSTGQPKAVMARHKNVVNYISRNEHNIFGKIVTDDFETIVSISTCSFDIFVTETIATLVNGLKVVLADEQECRNQYALNRLLTREKGQFLQTTPTKLKALTKEPSQRDFLKNIKAILLGGEAMEWSYLNELKEITNAKIYNIYGVTEVPIWSAFTDTDTFKDEITIGRGIANTQMYVVDKYLNPTPIGVMGELCIAGDSVSSGYLNNPELTAEKFIDNPFGEGKLYKTGDHAYWREDGNLVFVGRKDFQVKIRGLRIELGEIESAIQSIEGIERAVVVVRKDNEDRQLLCAFFTGKEYNAKDLRTILSSKLPKYMVPHIFTHLEEMPLTSSGKANRNALPEIDLDNISTETEYVAPSTKKESILVSAIETVLDIENVSVLDNFFDLGGDSLKSIELVSELEDKGYTVIVKSIFEAKDIQSLAKELTEKTEKEEKIEYDSVMPATAAQMRVYTAQIMSPDSLHYNLLAAFKVEELDVNRLEESINKLIVRHESLRTSFENRNGQIVQIINEPKAIKLQQLDSDDTTLFNTPFDLSSAPLLKVGYYDNTIMLVIHHIITDGESMTVLCKELNELYMGRELPETVQYGEFAVTDNYTEENENYWLKEFSEEPATLDLPTDFARPEKQSFNGTSISSQIDKELNDDILNKCKQLGITPYAYYTACYNILLSKFSGNEDICVGMPISGRSSKFLNTIGMFVNTVVLRTNTEGNKSIRQLMQEVRTNSISAIDNQSYPYNELVKKLGISSSNRNPLFDVMFAYQNETLPVIIFGDEEVQSLPVKIGGAKCDLNFNIVPTRDKIALTVEYNTDLFREETINKFIKAYTSILTQALNENILIKDIEVLTKEEKETVLNNFNDTSAEYAKDKYIHELFEEQVAKKPNKVALVANDKTLTYAELNEEANKIAHSLLEKGIGKDNIVGIKLSRTSKFMASLLGILKSGAAYLPFDPTHPQDRIEQILSDSNAKLCIIEDNFNELLDNTNTKNPDIETSGESLCYCIYTSGSTGTPKGAMIQHKNLCWYTSSLMNIYGTDAINMPFFTSPAVDLSVTSIFLPLMTGGTTYFYDNDLLNDLSDIFDNEELNIIKLTPTHMQIIQQHIAAKSLTNMKHLIVGGEQLYRSTCIDFLEKFGTHIKIHNEYGPTETTVGCGDYVFSCNDISTTVSIGRPTNNVQMYIVDKYTNLLPVGVTGELCIAGDGVCAGYLNNEELTNEKFIDNPFGTGKLYKTGDLAYWREDGQIIYVGRNDFQVKINGQRIELGEIENAIANIDGVVQCAVIVREQYICAFYTGAVTDIKDFRNILSATLPRYMVPHSFTHLDSLPMTVSGKLDRKALPEIDFSSISTETEYVAPKTKEEQALVFAIETVLDAEKVSVLDNFFDLGGDSLKAIELISELENKSYTIAVKEIFAATDIRELAKKLKIKTEKERKVEYASVLPATSAQMRVYTSQMMNEESLHYNTQYAFKVDDLDVEKLQNAIDKLVARHESFRTSFATKDGQIMQVINGSATIKVENLSSDDISLFNAAFDLSSAPLLKVGYYENTVVIVAHHIITDGESMSVFFKELNELYMGRELPETVQYGEFAVTDSYTEENEKYWLNMFSEEPPLLELPLDFARPEKQTFEGSHIYEQIDISAHNKIADKCKALGITPYAYYMACYNILLSKFSGNEDICVGMPMSGRSSKFLNTIGMFVNTVVLRTNTNGNKTVRELMQEIRENSISAIDNQCYPYNELVKKLGISSSNRNPLFDVMFAYQSEEMTNITLGDKKAELVPLKTTSVKSELSFHILPRKEDVVLMAEYCTDLFKEETINKFVKAYTSVLTQCLDETKHIKDIDILTPEEKKKLLHDFNNTKTDYPRNKCIHELFEEQVAKTLNKVALVASDKTLTYAELNEEANKIAHSLLEKGLHTGNVVGIRLSRTSKFLVSVLGILKAGMTYLPFDMTHPQERIDKILSDSNAKLCITEDKFNELLDNINTENPDIEISGESLCYCIYTSGSTGAPKGAMIQHKNLCWYMSSLMSIYGTDAINMPFFTSPAVDLSVPSYFLPLVTGGTTYFYDNELLNDLNDIFNNEEINTIKVTPTHLQIILQHIEGNILHNMKYLISGGESLRRSSCIEFLQKYGEHIEIHNEYGPTETTVSCVDHIFSSEDDDDIVTIGSPIDNAQIYIVDKYTNLLPIGVTGELCIAGDGVCAGYLNNPELTSEKFIDNPFGSGKLYKTGDLAYWREDGNICYVGRNDFQVKINGQRIELGEIENAISSIDGVVQCAVIVREQYICAFYTGALTDARDFRNILSTKLPKYMIPHIFTHLEKMPMTTSDKINKNSLPEIDLESISTETEYIAPETNEEKALANAIGTVLNVEEVSMLDNFFNMGGDSITAIYLVSELEDSGYGLNVADIMQSDTLQDIAKAMEKKEEKDEFSEHTDVFPTTTDMNVYDQGEINGIVPFTPIMRAFLKKSSGAILNDFVHTCIISAECDEEIAQNALNVLFSHHDILRGTFTDNGIEVRSSNEYKAYSFESINIVDTSEAIEYLKNTKLDDKLVKVVFCKTEKENLICITVHHFLIDIVSWEVLMKDFTTVVNQLKNGEKISLSAKTASFKLWSKELQEYATMVPQKNKEYWEDINNTLDSANSLSYEEVNEAEEYNFTFSKEISDKLINKVNEVYDTRSNEVLLTALGVAASKLAKGAVGIIVESHGRTELCKPITIEKTIGWFTSCYPVVINNNKNIVEELLNIKETVRKIQKNGIEYLLLNEGFHKNTNIKFNFYQNKRSNESRENKLVEFNGSSSVFPNMINVACSITENVLSVLITVPKCMHKKGISEELGKEFIKQMEEFAKYTDVLPATAAQMRIYTAHFASTEPTLYNLSTAFKMENLDVDKFEQAINKLIARHEGLRTSFENRDGQIVQVISDTASIKLEKLESPDLSDFIKPFDLTKAPLIRVGYIDNTVIVDSHHIIADGSTFGFFYEEINELYMGRELPEAVQYREFAILDTYTKEDEKFWLKEFEEVPNFKLYTDYPKQEMPSDKGADLYARIDDEVNKNILIKCKKWGITPYDYHMACFSILLSKYSGNEDVCIGVTSSGRSSKFLNTWGMFVNMLPIRTKPESTKTFECFVNEIKDKSINAIAHQKYPQQKLIKKLNIKKPPYDVMFIFQSEKMTHSVIGDKKAELLPIKKSTSRAAIMFYIMPKKENALIKMEYLTDLFKEETINKFIKSYTSILTQALDEDILIKDIEVLTEEEKETINSFNKTEHTYDISANTTLYSLFEEKSKENKDKVCIKANGEEISFADFKAYAERIDNKVRSITNEEKSVIAVICERSFEMYGAVYGIIRGGNAYLPIDPNYPQDRIDYILEDSGAKAVITQDKFCHLAGNVPCIDATAVLNSTEQPTKAECLALPEDTAYVIYTSGSTGNPKGAKISHKSAINRILWMHDFYPLEENDVILQKTPYTFDVSVWELFWWGITGRTLCASKPDEHFLPAKILQETETNKVTHLHFVPSVFDLFLTYLENNPQEQDKFSSVKYVFLSGEALTANSINRFYNIYDYNKVQLHNLYGPTECAVDVSYYACTPTDIDPVPIGKPIYNTQLHIVDKHLNPTPIGVTGELCIAGINVGQGYLNNEELTNEKFIDNPFGTGKLYKTGDLAYWREDGQIIYVGRNDFQVKINGQRIELGEIEKVISEVTDIESVAVIIKENNGQDALVAFCCGNENAILEVIAHCENKLPQYMLPSKFQFIQEMPLNHSGKLDRNALKNIDVVFDNVVIKEEPVTETEKRLCELFQDILQIDFVGRNESFFNLGGTSLDMIAILSENELQNIPAATFIANPTPKKLAILLDAGTISDSDGFYTLNSTYNSDKALILIPYAGGDASAFAALTKVLERIAPEMSVYYVDYLRSYEQCEIVANKIKELSKAKEINIYSHCAGTAVALQLINILEKEGIGVSNYITGGFIPSTNPPKRNGWNYTFKRSIQRKLIKAGAPIEKFSAESSYNMVEKFRKDTDFMTEYFYKRATPINAKTSVIISKTDIFTQNYAVAEKLWKTLANNFNKLHYIDTDSHYFQTEKSEEVAQIIIDTLNK